EVELVEQFLVEFAARLVAGEELMPVRGNEQCIPADEHCTRARGVPEPQEEVRKADERVRRLLVRAADRLWKRVVRAVRERVAVDHEQRPLHRPSTSFSISAISR